MYVFTIYEGFFAAVLVQVPDRFFRDSNSFKNRWCGPWKTESCGVQDWQVCLEGRKALPMHSTFKSLLCEGVMCCRLFSNSAICLVREFSRQFWRVPPFHETRQDGDTFLIHQFLLPSGTLRLTQTLKTGESCFPTAMFQGFPTTVFQVLC